MCNNHSINFIINFIINFHRPLCSLEGKNPVLDRGMIELTTESVYFAVNKILVLRTKEVVPQLFPARLFYCLHFWFSLKGMWINTAVRQQERNYRIRAYEEPLEGKKNGRLLDCVRIILNNLLKRKMDFAFLCVL